ncbi:MAG: PIN domain-containing protein [Methanomassiliicoccales archaeon]|nr:MAG: PIN domain-containing protein [Methanomassiliicoccales archaeon]
MTVTFDSSAWIEYFSGSDLGRIVKGYVDTAETIYTPTIDLLEIKNKYQREKKKWKSRIDFICDRSSIVDIDTDIALLAADMKKDFGLYSIDAMIYASARMTKSKLLTKDKHFKELKDVVILE